MKETLGHDPLCPWKLEAYSEAVACPCDLIARVRAQIAADIEAEHEASGDDCYAPGGGKLIWQVCTHPEDAAIARGTQ